MHELDYLKDLVVILAAAVAVVTILHRFRIPSIAGFILAGVLVGPRALALIADPEQVELLAEIGVALLLFGIGLELSLERLKRLWRAIMIGGTLQVGITIVLTVAAARWLGAAPGPAVFVGFLMAVSSTAIVLRGLEQRAEVDAPHGRLTLGVLVFQDLCVVPMMLTIPILAGDTVSGGAVLAAVLKAGVILLAVIGVSRLAMPRLLAYVAATRQRHLFTMAVVLVCLGTAWLITAGGVSLALGAFLAGMVVAGSEFRHQALADLSSFRDVFSSVFFVSVGMLLDPQRLAAGIGPILLILSAILAGKFVIVFATGTLMRLPVRVSVLSGVALAQVGEFSFVLDRAARDAGVLSAPLDGQLLAAAILSMLITPFAIALGPRMAAGVGRIRVLTRLLDVRDAGEAAPAVQGLREHVIIGGYGFAGEELARALKKMGVAYVIVDLNVENVHKAAGRGEPAFFGDITNQEVLESLGLHHARDFVIVINDSEAVDRAVRAARAVAPGVNIIARTNYFHSYDRLMAAGANDVIPAEREAAAAVTARVLARHGASQAGILDCCAEIRSRSHD